jgi:hypothetical protein
MEWVPILQTLPLLCLHLLSMETNSRVAGVDPGILPVSFGIVLLVPRCKSSAQSQLVGQASQLHRLWMVALVVPKVTGLYGLLHVAGAKEAQVAVELKSGRYTRFAASRTRDLFNDQWHQDGRFRGESRYNIRDGGICEKSCTTKLVSKQTLWRLATRTLT